MNFNEIAGRIFSHVLEASIAAAVLGLIVLALEQLLRKRLSPAWLFVLYLPVLFRLLLPILPESPASLSNLPRWISPTPATKPQLTTTTEATSATAISAIAPAQAAPFVNSAPSTPGTTSSGSLVPSLSAFQILSLVWLAITSALLLRLIIGAIRFSRKLAEHPPVSPEITELLATARQLFNSRATPRLIETRLVNSPCLFGILRPKLLLPHGLARRLSAIELQHVFLHELAHLKRRDLWVNALIAIAQAIHWFNPVVWLVFHRMKLQRELACDRLVLEYSRGDAQSAKVYGETLLKLFQSYGGSAPAPATVGIVEGAYGDELRLRQIAAFKPSRPKWILGSTIVLLLAASGLSNAQNPPKATPTTDAKPAIKSPVIHEQAAPATGIQALEREYEQRKQQVHELEKEMSKLRRELGIINDSSDGSNATSEQEELQQIRQDIRKNAEGFTQEKALLDYLKKIDGDQLRKVLPTMLQPADQLLNRYLGDLAAAEQNFALLSKDFSDEHPDVKGAVELIATINRQIQDRIEGIIAGLDARTTMRQKLLEELQIALDRARARQADMRERFTPYFEAKRALESSQRMLDTIYMRLIAEKVDAQVGKKPAESKQ